MGREATRAVSGGRPSVAEALRAHASVVCLHLPSDRISASSPRVVGDARARALCADMKRCSYYETCATYGLNVDRVFQEGELGHPLHMLGGWGTWIFLKVPPPGLPL